MNDAVDAFGDRPVPALHAAEHGRRRVREVAGELDLAALRHGHDALQEVVGLEVCVTVHGATHTGPRSEQGIGFVEEKDGLEDNQI